MSADQVAENGVAEMATLGRFDKLQFAPPFRLHPDSVFHLLGGEAVPGNVRLGKIHKRALGCSRTAWVL